MSFISANGILRRLGMGDRAQHGPRVAARGLQLCLEARRDFCLRVNIDDLVTRVLQSGGVDYWESGMGPRMGEDLYESFIGYQKCCWPSLTR